MRFKITFRLEGKPQVLPLNYKHPVSSWIYKTLANADREFTNVLHENGYSLENGKSFKLFTFSDFQLQRGTWKILGDRMKIWADSISLIVSFMLPEQTQHFVSGLFQSQQVQIGDEITKVKMTVQNIEALPVKYDATNAVHLKCLSPIFIARKVEGRKHPEYIAPTAEGYDEIFTKNLLDKYKSHCLHTGTEPVQFETSAVKLKNLSDKPKSTLQTIKAFKKEETKIQAYRFNFELTAPKEILEVGLNAGFGAENAQGFGCCEVVSVVNKEG